MENADSASGDLTATPSGPAKTKGRAPRVPLTRGVPHELNLRTRSCLRTSSVFAAPEPRRDAKERRSGAAVDITCECPPSERRDVSAREEGRRYVDEREVDGGREGECETRVPSLKNKKWRYVLDVRDSEFIYHLKKRDMDSAIFAVQIWSSHHFNGFHFINMFWSFDQKYEKFNFPSA